MNEFSQKIESLKPLVKAYAREMNILIVEDENMNVEFYKLAFGNLFNVCDVARNGKEALEKWKQDKFYYDLIVTDVEMPIMSGLELIEQIRQESMMQSILVITGIQDIEANQDLAYYYIDGLLPKPVDTKKLYILLYRVLQKITEKKEFYSYVQNMELQLNEAVENINSLRHIEKKLSALQEHHIEVDEALGILRTIIGKYEFNLKSQQTFSESTTSFSEQKTSTNSDSKNEKDLRFSTHDKVLSSSDLIEQLDDTIIDKVEDFVDILNSMATKIYDIETQEPNRALESIAYIRSYIDEFIDILNNLIYFPIVSRAFLNLNTFLSSITMKQLQESEKKLLLASLLLLIEKDISRWIDTIFIKREADNIYYFDASFANGVLEIESMFQEQSRDEDFEEIEFF